MSDDGFSIGGIIRLIAVAIIVWGLMFGVTFKGKHYALRCSEKSGVEVTP